MRKFIGIGGTVIIDAGGGSSEFASSAEALLKTLVPNAEATMQLLPPDSPLYTLANEAIPNVAYRTYAQR